MPAAHGCLLCNYASKALDLRVLVVEPEAIRRRLLVEAVDASENLASVGALPSLRGQLEDGHSLVPQPDIFLISGSLLESEPNELAEINERFRESYFVIYESQPRLETLLLARNLRVRGFLTFNHLSTDEFKWALGVVAHGGAFIEPLSARYLLEHISITVEQRDVSPWCVPDLSARENEVLALVRQGLSNKEIAVQMSISLGTVRAHLRNIFRKLDVSSRAGAASFEGRFGRPRRFVS